MRKNAPQTFTTKDDIQDWLTSAIARSLNLQPDEIDTSVAFDRYGMDSVVAVELTGDLEKLAGRSLSPTLMYDYPTIEALSAHVADELALGTEVFLAEAV
jgi:acyl carrier protein